MSRRWVCGITWSRYSSASMYSRVAPQDQRSPRPQTHNRQRLPSRYGGLGARGGSGGHRVGTRGAVRMCQSGSTSLRSIVGTDGNHLPGRCLQFRFLLNCRRWQDNPVRAALKGRKCRLIATGTRNTVLIEMADTGERVTTGRRALRKAKGEA